jgi:hypothetical protein
MINDVRFIINRHISYSLGCIPPAQKKKRQNLLRAGSRFLGASDPRAGGRERAMRPGPPGSERPSTHWPRHAPTFFFFFLSFAAIYSFLFFQFFKV